MNCIGIDDEPMALDIVWDYCQKLPFLKLVKTFRNAIEALMYLENEQIDLIFLDINMPDITGMQFLKSMKTKPLVIFTTAYTEYALDSYEFEAIDYLLKPIEFDRFLKAVMKAKDRFFSKSTPKYVETKPLPVSLENQNRDNFIMVKSGQEIYRIVLDDILYIEGSGNYLTFITEKKKIMSLMNMKDISGKLPYNQFVRIHKSYIVPISRIDIIERHQVKIKEITIPLGPAYRDNFFQIINQFLNRNFL